MRRIILALLTASCFALSAAAAKRPPTGKSPAPGAVPPDTTVIELGGTAQEVHTGGSGRFLIFRLKDSEKIAVVDVVLGKIVKQIPAPGDSLFAASRDKLIIVLNNQRVIQRWDLKTLEREKSVILPDDRPVRVVAMGPNGNGPVLVWPRGQVEFFDVTSLRPLTVKGDVVNADNGGIWSSADGLTFCAWGWTSGPYHLMRLSNLTATSVDCTMSQTPESDAYNEAWAMPSADGSQLIRHGAHVLDRELSVIEAGPLKGTSLFPTGDPRFLVALRRTDPYSAKNNSVSIVAAADLRVIYTMQDMEPVTGGDIGTVIGKLRVEPRVRYLPSENLVVTIPDSNTQVFVHHFELEKALKALNADYLYVISKPQTRVRAGDTYSYQIEALSNAGGIKYRVEDGPQGLTVSGNGLVNWRVAGSGRVGVLISVTDASGQEVMHSIVLNVLKEGSSVVAAAENPPSSKPPAHSQNTNKPNKPSPVDTNARNNPPSTAKPPATAPAGSPPAPAAIVAKLKGVWTAKPPMDKARIRASLIKRGAPEAQLDAIVEKILTTNQGFRVIYAFEADGSVLRSYGNDADPHTTAAHWQMTGQKGDSEVTVKIDGDDATKSETRTITFTAADKFTTKLSSPVISPDLVVEFTRGSGPPPAVGKAPAGGQPGARGAAPGVPATAAELEALKSVGKKLAEILEKEAEDEMIQDPGPIIRLSTGYKFDRVEATTIGARLVVGNTDIKQHRNGGDTIAVHSLFYFELRRQDSHWACVSARRVINFDDPEHRATVDISSQVIHPVEEAQGIKVQKAEKLSDGDKPLPGEADELIKALAARLARDTQAGMHEEARKVPGESDPKVRVVSVARTKSGAAITLFATSTLNRDGENGGPAEFADMQSTIVVTLRSLPGGKWHCASAMSQLIGVTTRHGPALDQSGPAKDMTADVQAWLDGPPAAAPVTRPSSAAPATRPQAQPAKK